MQEMFSRYFEKKFKKKKYKPKYFYLESLKSIDEALKKCDAKITKFDFGTSYLYIRNKVAYKIVIINSPDIYFNNKVEEQKNVKANKQLESCEKFIGFEIFDSQNEEVIDKTSLYTFQSEKFYYAGFYYLKDDNILVQTNFEQPNDNNHENYEFMINLLRITPEDNN